MEIIYCDTADRRSATLAVETGFLYGAQLPARNVYYAPHFADQNWKKPDREKYVAAVAQYRPQIATVLDWEQEEQLPDVLEWAEAIAPYVQRICLIPKVNGGIARLPRQDRRQACNSRLLSPYIVRRYDRSACRVSRLAGSLARREPEGAVRPLRAYDQYRRRGDKRRRQHDQQDVHSLSALLER